MLAYSVTALTNMMLMVTNNFSGMALRRRKLLSLQHQTSIFRISPENNEHLSNKTDDTNPG